MHHALCPMRFFLTAMRFAFCALPILLILALLPGVVCAQGLIQGISGALEFDYSFFSTKTKDATGVTTKTVANNYNPRFTLNIDTKIFPNLRLHAGGIVEANITDSKTGGTDIKATVSKLRPYIDLTLETPLYTAAIGYYRMQDRTEVQRSPSVTLVNDQYYANLGWRPEGLPSIDMRFMRTNSYDEDRDLRDIQEDNITLVSRYFYKGLQVYYQGNYLHTMDDLNNLDVKQQLHSGRVTYADSFLNGRVSFNTTYDIFYNEVKTFSEGEGFVTTQIFPFAGLSIIANPVGDPDPIALIANPALINGNTTANAGIDLVADAPWVKRQMGLDFLNPTDVNQLLVWVDRELTSTIASSFSWDVWTSSDNIDWRRLTTIPSAPFGPFQNRFELNFPSVRTEIYKGGHNSSCTEVPLLYRPIFLSRNFRHFFVRMPQMLQEKQRGFPIPIIWTRRLGYWIARFCFTICTIFTTESTFVRTETSSPNRDTLSPMVFLPITGSVVFFQGRQVWRGRTAKNRIRNGLAIFIMPRS